MEITVTPKELNSKKDAELIDLEEKMRMELATLSVKASLGQVSDTTRSSKLKKDVARLLTIKTQRATKEKK
jgi:ribosomal protein L29